MVLNQDQLQHNLIHPSAIVSEKARLGRNVHIGPFCIVGDDVTIEDGVKLHSHVVVEGKTRLGQYSCYYPFTTIGLAPQDMKYAGEVTSCRIGAHTIVREHSSIHRGTQKGGGETRIGEHVLIMANAHIAHDCVIGDRVVIVNHVVMGGHVVIGADARIMGSAALHQYVRIGPGALVSGLAGVEGDVIPYGSVIGNRARLVGLHWVWLQRHQVPHKEIKLMREAFYKLYPLQWTGTPFNQRIERVEKEFADCQRVMEIVNFIKAPSRRRLVPPFEAGKNIS